MIKSEIKNLIFDIGGVIIFKKRIDFLKFDNSFSFKTGTTKKIIDICFKEKMLDKDFDEKSFFSSRFSNLLNWEDYQKILKEIYKTETVNKDILTWIEKKKKRYKIFLLTNNTKNIRDLLKNRFKIDYLFSFIFNSAEIGLAKPDRKFFEYVLNEIDSPAKNCLFVDDNSKNTEAAKNIGFSTILFNGNANFFENIEKMNI